MHPRSLRAAATGAVIAIFAITAPAPHAGAAAASSCTATSGVTVIVDFTHFDRAIERGCAAGQPATALDALHSAGFQTAGTANYGDAFVCRIDGLPSPKSEACAITPPGNASWSFYFAKRTDTAWTYSATGVTSFEPAPGSLMAFAFGNHAKPGVLPSGAVVTHPTTPTPTAPPRTTPTTGPRVTAASAPSDTTTPPTTLAPPSSTTLPNPPLSKPTTAPAIPTSTTATASTSTTVPVVDRSTARIVSRESSGSPIPALLTIGAVLLLAAVALLIVRARRSRSA